MAQPTENTGKKPLSREEASRHAANVRWGKEQPFAPNQDRIKQRIQQILAQKKKAKGGKGKGAKPKLTDEQKQAEKDNARAINLTKVGESTDLGDHLSNLDQFDNGKEIQPADVDELTKRGLVERGTDGTPRMTAAGQALVNAAARGDIRAAHDALSRGRDATARNAERATTKQEREKAAAEKPKQASGGGGKKQAKPEKEQATAPSKERATDERATKEKQAENRAKVAQAMADQDAGLSPAGSAALAAFADGTPLELDTAKQFEDMGLVETSADGAPRLTYAGQTAARAMSRGDVRATIDAVARAADTKKAKGEAAKQRADVAAKREQAQAKRDEEKAKRVQEKAERQAKDDASRARVEAARIEAEKNRKALDMSDMLAIKAGARHSRSDIQHLQAIHDSAVACGADCGDMADDDTDDDEMDVDGAEKAIKSLMDNPQWYAQHECGDIAQAANALHMLSMLLQSELAEEDEDTAHITMLCDAGRILVKFIAAEFDELEGAAGDVSTVGDRPMKALDDESWLHIDGGAVKAVDDTDTIKGLAILYATKATHDIERDYYDKNTDLWLEHWGWPRPITYHHGMDKGTRDDPVIGHWTKAIQTDEGVWLEGQLDRAHRYYKAIKELARRGYLKISSDSGPQWTIREPQENGANYIKRWPLVTASLTTTPMEPRMLPVEVKAYLAELGYDTIDDSQEAINPDVARRDGVKATEDERARRLLLELELLQLEAA